MSTLPLLLGTVLMAMAAEPVAPKLETLPTAPAGAAGEPAVPVPSVVTICVDRTAARCWTVSGVSTCKPGTAYARSASGAADVGVRLRACWDALHRP